MFKFSSKLIRLVALMTFVLAFKPVRNGHMFLLHILMAFYLRC